MGQRPPLDELAARKRLVQAKMELHRAEVALYYQQVTAPLQKMRWGMSFLTSRPLILAALLSGLGFFLMRGRLRFARKIVGFAVPLILPRVRTFLMGRVWRWAFKGIQFAIRSR